MKKLLVIAAIIILSGCAMTPAAPIVQEVRVPVSVPCKIIPPEAPAFAVDGLPIGSILYDQMIALRAERLQRIGFESELIAAIKACQ